MKRKGIEERRKHIVVKGIKITERKRREAVEEMIKDVGAKAEVEIKRVKGNEEEKTEIWVKLENEEQRREVRKKEAER